MNCHTICMAVWRSLHGFLNSFNVADEAVKHFDVLGPLAVHNGAFPNLNVGYQFVDDPAE